MNNPELVNLEKNKEIKPEVKILTPFELEKIIYKGESLPQDDRFLPSEKGGVFKYFDISDFTNVLDKSNKFYPVIKIENKIVGLAELEENPNTFKTLWIKFLSIDSNQQNKGYASKLAEEIFKFAQKEGYSIESSSYSEIGYQKLKELFIKFAEKFDVNFIDTDKKV